ncbi:MAG: TIGR00645 family protein [Gammaproteobacteria bacterium]|nr:TIGR00645 family protein [Gammaproteobacteria bacterium]
MKKIEHALEILMFNSRWLLAPFYIGLVVGIGMLLVKFVQEFFHIVPHLFSSSESDLILSVLTLVDMSLVANLLLMIIFSGYENFVSKINTGDHEDRPAWMGKVDFSGLKVKLIASIVAISAIELLKTFVKVEGLEPEQLSWSGPIAWKVLIHVVLIVSGVLFTVMDRIAEGTSHGKKQNDH